MLQQLHWIVLSGCPVLHNATIRRLPAPSPLDPSDHPIAVCVELIKEVCDLILHPDTRIKSAQRVSTVGIYANVRRGIG